MQIHSPPSVFSPLSCTGSSEKNESRRYKRNKPTTQRLYNLECNYLDNGCIKVRTHGHSLSLLSNSSVSTNFDDTIEVPELSDSNLISDTSDFPITPTKPPTSLLNCLKDSGLADELSGMVTAEPMCRKEPFFMQTFYPINAPTPKTAAHSLFKIPELVRKIIYFADLQAISEPPMKTQPSNSGSGKRKGHFSTGAGLSFENGKKYNVLSSCLLVNRLFNQITRSILGERLRFENLDCLEKLASSDISTLSSMKPRTFKLDRLYHAKQATLERIAAAVNASHLHTLDFFLCPKVAPPLAFFTSSLITFSVAGSRVVDDYVLIDLAERCHQLQNIDIRACDSVTDAGIYAVASHCKQLVAINFGRKRKGHLITDSSVAVLVKNNPLLETVGLAGCSVTDVTIWELVMSSGKNLRRLSINGCLGITDNSISQILSHDLVPELCVLEIRDVPSIKNNALIINFKRHQALKGILLWIVANEATTLRLRECERTIDLLISMQIRQDILEWAHTKDEDVLYREFMSTRAAA